MMKWIFSVFGCTLLAMQSEACGLRVLTEDLPPYQVVQNHQVVAGSAYLQVEAILRSAGLPCRTEVLPWARSYELARSQPNTLIYSLARLPAREHLFIWLAPLIQADYRFFSADNKVIEQIQQGKSPLDFIAVAVAGSMMDSTLQQFGFVPDQNLIHVKDVNAQWKMLQINRAQLTLAFEPDFKALADLKVRQTQFFASRLVLLQIQLYLAAHPQTDPVLLEQLKIAVEQQALQSLPVNVSGQ
jgi:polar amino acid transport system substrate-binding protein